MNKIYFVCLHGSAKSLIAMQHFRRLAQERGLPYEAASVGLEPDDEVPPPVVAGLRHDGFDVRGYVPRPLNLEQMEDAAYIVTFGCDLPASLDAIAQERWDDLPMVSDGFEPARDAIVAGLEQLVARVGKPPSVHEGGS